MPPTMKDSLSSRTRAALLAGTAGLALTFGTACTDENGVNGVEDGIGGNGGDGVEEPGAAEFEPSSDGLLEEDPGPEFGNDDGTGTFEDEGGELEERGLDIPEDDTGGGGGG